MRRALPALGVCALAAAALLAPGLRIPGQRGAAQLASSFRPGRWDARFLVARHPAALSFPAQPLRVRLTLSGPARVALEAGGVARSVVLGPDPRALELDLAAGGRVDLAADDTIRLHELEVSRAGPPPWGRLAAVVLAGLAGAAIALGRRGRAAVAASVLLAALVCPLALRGSLGELVLEAGFDSLAPALAVGALGACIVAAPLLAPKGASPASAPRSSWPWLFGGGALVLCVAQVALFAQPLLIGDPAAYHDIGGRFAAALSAVRSPDGLADAVESLRPYAGLWAPGLLYGLLRGLHDTPATIFLAHSLATAGAVFFLVRAALRLAGRRLAIVAGTLALLYPTLPILCGVVQPEPVILLLWTGGFDLLLAGRESGDARRLALSGLAFGLGLALHPQGIVFLLAAFGLVLAPFARALARPRVRRGAAAFALGLLPVVSGVAAGDAYARPAVSVLDRDYGFWAYTARVPLGFWLFIDTDGWQGPLRLDDTRYARGLFEAEEAGPLGGLGRAAFTLRFVAENLPASLRTVLRNLDRLFDLPDNPYRRDFVLPSSLAIAAHRALYVLFLLSAPLALARRAAPLFVPYLMLAATYPLYHAFDKYAVPAVPFVLLGAALALEALLESPSRGLLAALAAAGLGAGWVPADLALHGVPPVAARLLLAVLHFGGLAAAFVLAARLWAKDRAGRLAAAAGGALLLVPALAADLGNPGWRTFSVALDREARHEIRTGAEGRARLDSAREAFLLLDLEIPDGDPARLSLRFDSGLEVPGAALTPTMPTFGFATLRGGLSPRSFRQWWRVGWRPEMMSGDRLGLTLRGTAAERLYGGLATPDAHNVDHGLSLGQWPYLSVYRMMHDGEYRLPVGQRLEGLSRSSRRAGRVLPGTLGVRLVILAEPAPSAVWRTGPAPAVEVVTAVWARAGRAARADLVLPAGRVRMDFEHPGRWSGPGGEVVERSTGEYEGWFSIRTAATPGRPLTLSVVPLEEMSPERKFFFPELRPDPPLPPEWAHLPLAPPAEVVAVRKSQPWRVAGVF